MEGQPHHRRRTGGCLGPLPPTSGSGNGSTPQHLWALGTASLAPRKAISSMPVTFTGSSAIFTGSSGWRGLATRSGAPHTHLSTSVVTPLKVPFSASPMVLEWSRMRV